MELDCNDEHFSVLAIVDFFEERSVRKNTEKKSCWLYSVPGSGHVTRTKNPFRSCWKTERGTICASSVFGPTRLRHGPKAVLLLSRTKKSFIHVDWVAKHRRSRLLSIDILKIENIGTRKENLCKPDIVLVCLRTISGQQVGWNHALDNVYYLGSEKRHSVFLLECCAELNYGFYFRNKRGIVMHKTGNLICIATPLRRFHYCIRATVMYPDALHKYRSLKPCYTCSLLKDTQRSKKKASHSEELQTLLYQKHELYWKEQLHTPQNGPLGRCFWKTVFLFRAQTHTRGRIRREKECGHRFDRELKY